MSGDGITITVTFTDCLWAHIVSEQVGVTKTVAIKFFLLLLLITEGEAGSQSSNGVIEVESNQVQLCVQRGN